mmetsp:Transcript_13083/g.28337  ORF Transcript_13083/g.28337 Transcript_13083/m.28337 type:complete len:201 (+) Transcript_13083:326-928(+)
MLHGQQPALSLPCRCLQVRNPHAVPLALQGSGLPGLEGGYCLREGPHRSLGTQATALRNLEVLLQRIQLHLGTCQTLVRRAPPIVQYSGRRPLHLCPSSNWVHGRRGLAHGHTKPSVPRAYRQACVSSPRLAGPCGAGAPAPPRSGPDAGLLTCSPRRAGPDSGRAAAFSPARCGALPGLCRTGPPLLCSRRRSSPRPRR